MSVAPERRPPPDAATAAPPVRAAAGSPRAWTLFVAVAVAVLAVDLVVKRWAFEHVAGVPVHVAADGTALIPPHDATTIVPRVLSLKLTLNHGAAFGLGDGARWLFVCIALVAAVIVVGMFCRSDRRAWPLHVAFAMLLAGAMGNLYDRVAVGAVRDMLWMFPGVKLPFGWSWPGGSDDLYPWIFNVADAALCMSLVVLLVLMYRADRANARVTPSAR